MANKFRIVIGKSEGREPFGDLRRISEYNIENGF
jgi:hypothetical protein